ncbi:MAG: putative T7SS-secreted protein, partial [Actinomycetota bacterium]
MGTEQDWHGLGFNPARGSTFTVRSLASDVKTVGDELAEAHRLLESIGKNDGVWEGESARAFTKKVGELPKLLKQAKDSMKDCARALDTWHDRLAAMQKEAHGLELDARRARAKTEEKKAAYDDVNVPRQGPPGEKITAAQEDWITAKDQLDALIDKAEKLEARWKDKAGEAERLILTASENHPPDPGLWDQFTDGSKWLWRNTKDWLVDNADLMSAISGGIATVGLALSATGVGAPLGLVLAGIGAAGGAMAGHWMGNARGNGTSKWQVAADGLGLAPGVGAIKGFATAGKSGLAGWKTLGGGAGLAKRGEELATGLDDAFRNPASVKAVHWLQGKVGMEATKG